jgi:hypothetical protein
MLSDLLPKLAAQLSPEERKAIVIFGSSAIVLRGVALGRKVNDLDLFVSDSTFEALALRFPLECKEGKDGEKGPSLTPLVGEKVEIFKSFLGVNFETVLAHASKTDASQNFLVGSFDDIKTWKNAQGREKDINDIKVIENHVKRSNAT